MKPVAKIGTIGFGQINSYPPAHWKYWGLRNGAHEFTHVNRPGQTPFPPQFVSAQMARRILYPEQN